MDQTKTSANNKPLTVGVLLTRNLIRKTFLSQDSIYRIKELVEANKISKTNLIFFSRGDIDFTNRKVLGAYYDYSTCKWAFKSFPLPDVLYVRGGSAKRVRKLISRLDSMGLKRINPIVAFNKGKLFQMLSEDDNVNQYLPATESVENMSEIRMMIQKLGTVYIKARRGRKGMQVMRVEKLSSTGYLYSYSILGKLVRKRVNSMAGLELAISRFFGKNKVIVQKAIDLARVDNDRLCDFRAEVQRNKSGEIEIVGICIRVGQSNSPITTHANAYKYDTYLKELFPSYNQQKINSLKAKIHSFLLKVYNGVEQRYGKFGEIGIDFAVDRSGEIWLIECNAQSAKVSLGKAYGDYARRAYVNPLEYAKYITGYKSSGSSNRSSGTSNTGKGTANRSSGTADRSKGSAHQSGGANNAGKGSGNRSGGAANRSKGSAHRSGGANNAGKGSGNHSGGAVNRSKGSAPRGRGAAIISSSGIVKPKQKKAMASGRKLR
ncbi:YheC/YheD family protein [Paenibacillus sp. NEAU-GSW1]|uniref:YheC/YheD family endospore coat-associated protein n=1 Tax=Paenibacillus sp. NEAU-GSW1 TaxID=2682486 RepID=UPI0012E311CE|nr:YheC/YheD family protein [Paenibacillus sp. NEAU-GSW1]MUT68017.1 hypothetical protein [Paenibacillus sp. NEAU-GSW1]